ncbi:MAG: hypothetical protein HRU19_24875 [Pseudobacteriovorax sp.]|nr:hypothetical protein [Pseudobacteriovorax sp.]
MEFRHDQKTLDHDWEFYPDKLLTPLEIVTYKGPQEPLSVPKTWPAIDRPGLGVGTYRTRIRLDRERYPDLSIILPFVSTASRVFINNEIFFESGTVGLTPDQSIPSRRYAVKPLPPASDIEIVMQISNFHHARGGTWHPIEIGITEKINTQYDQQMIIYAVVIGGYFMMGLYYFFVFTIRRQTAPLGISLCCIISLVHYSFNNNLALKFISPDYFHSYFRVAYFSQYTMLPAFCFYAKGLFPEYYSNWLTRIVYGVGLLSVLTITLPTRIYTEYLHAVNFLSVVMGIFIIHGLIKAYLDKKVGAKLILLGATIILFSGIFDEISAQVFDNRHFHIFHLSFLFFILTQGLAISQVYNTSFTELLREKQINRHSFDQLAKVVYTHQLNSMKEGKQLEDTMPTHQSECCVICFDIISSSKIKHIKAKEFYRELFLRCNNLMMKHYDPHTLTANAYRIKEMGDGFLCSVGYPFKSTSGNAAIDALELTYKFIEILEDVSEILDPVEPICCGVGIALDNISGFYPESGTQEYDLFGKAILLATRYESMRKTIERHGPSDNIIIVSERVFESISSSHRNDFKSIDLEAEKISVRDDPGAQRLYFRLVKAKKSSAIDLLKNTKTNLQVS